MASMQLVSKALAPLIRRELSSNTMCSVKNVCVIGSGLMGSGIAQVTAQASLSITLIDQSDAILNRSVKRINESLKRIAKKKLKNDEKMQASMVDQTMGLISTSTNLEKAVQNADLVIEAIVEKLPEKQQLFAQIELALSRPAILATNTSSLRLQDIANNLKNKSQFGGLHFFNPVPMMKLCEVVRFEHTSDATLQTLLNFGKTLGKTTVTCKDTPGFIVNRLLIPFLIEAICMAERGDATIQDIDTAMKLGTGHPMGPFELLDYVGLDTTKFIQDGWHHVYPDEKLFQPNAKLDKLVAEGKFGKKSGEGFYKYK